MTFTVQIGRPIALFVLPGERFDQVTSKPLREASARAPTKTKEAANK